MDARQEELKAPTVSAVLAIGALAINALTSMATIWLLPQVINSWKRVAEGRPLSDEVATAINEQILLLQIVYLAAYFASGILFIVWMYRCHRNLFSGRLDKNEFSVKWTILGFLVPVLNFIRPYEVMREIWAGSRFVAGAEDVPTWRRVRPRPLLRWWWTSFIGACLLASFGSLSTLAISAPGGGELRAWIKLCTRIVSIISAALAISVVVQTTKLQRRAQIRVRDVAEHDAA